MSCRLSTHRGFYQVFRSVFTLITVATLIVLTPCNTARAVDGYKAFKFGLSSEQVRQKCPVPLEEVTNAGFADTFGKDCRVLVAKNFKMLDVDREVNFVFTKKGLAVVAFVLQAQEFSAVAKTLGEKYPGAKLYPSPAEYHRIAMRFDAGQPNTTVKITYDDDTVMLLGIRDLTGEATYLLWYQAVDANQQEISTRAKDDL
jgi:hypothetical protein